MAHAVKRTSPPTTAIAATVTRLGARLHEQSRDGALVVGHRGAAADWPENTLPSFAAAVDAGATLVELDFRQAACGTLVCLHDATLDRTTDARERGYPRGARLRDHAFDAVAELDAGTWKAAAFAGTRLPSLAEALDVIAPHAVPVLERKDGDAAALLQLLRARDLVEQVLVIAFDWPWLAELHHLEPRLLLGALGGRRPTRTTSSRAAAMGAGAIDWDWRHLRRDDVAAWRAAGFVTAIYTADADAAILGCAAIGVQLITTNVPRRAAALLRGR